MIKKLSFLLLLLGAVLFVEEKAWAEDKMIFIHSPGCLYCEMWREDVLPLYHKTDEGKRLPLREVNIDKGLPKDLKHLAFPAYTPTFIIVNGQNKEISRIVGYNKEFFWGFVQEAIKKLNKTADKS